MKTPEKALGATEELKENVRASYVARRRAPLQLESSELASWRRGSWLTLTGWEGVSRQGWRQRAGYTRGLAGRTQRGPRGQCGRQLWGVGVGRGRTCYILCSWLESKIQL